MQEIKKRRIVLASILKPLNDPRMHARIGQTLASDHEVHIIGQYQQSIEQSAIVLHPIGPFGRISMQRIFAPFGVMMKLLRLKPHLLIICTHELLGTAFLVKAIIGCRVVYDVQENYARNIYYGRTFPFYVRPVLAGYVRLKEWTLSWIPDHFFLAEKSYVKQLAFTMGRATILENKLKRTQHSSLARAGPSDGLIHLLFSGTLAETTGVFTAIEIAIALHRADPRIRLTIIGFASQEHVRKKLRVEASDKPFVQLRGVDRVVPHNEILEAIKTADFGIISYPLNKSTAESMPTKLFEYAGHCLPILLIENPLWEEYCRQYPAAIIFDADNINAEAILSKMISGSFYVKKPEDAFWESEEDKVREAVSKQL